MSSSYVLPSQREATVESLRLSEERDSALAALEATQRAEVSSSRQVEQLKRRVHELEASAYAERQVCVCHPTNEFLLYVAISR